MKKIKIITAVLLCLVLAAAFIACSEKEKEKTNTQTPTGTNTEGPRVEHPDAPDLEPFDMGKKTFTFFLLDEQRPEIAPETLSTPDAPDPIEEAVYQRKLKIEELYNITLNQVIAGADPIKQYQDAIFADDTTYDAAITRCENITSMLVGNYLRDFEEIPNLNPDKEYWNTNFYNSLSLLGKHYLLDGDISKKSLECVWILAFNKTLIKNNGLESPFDLVKNGEWTYDKMHEMAKHVAKDTDGDGKMTLENDLWGINYNGNTIMGVINSSGVRLAELDQDGIPVLTMGNEINLAKLEKIYTSMRNPVYSIDTLFKAGGGTTDFRDVQIFREDRCLFVLTATNNVSGFDGYNLRSAEVDFGIIPYPKWDSTITKYTPYTANNFHPVLTVPNTNRDLENTGKILDMMCIEHDLPMRYRTS